MADEDKTEVTEEVTEEVIVPETPDATALASDGQVLAAIASLATQVSIGLETVNARIDALVSQPQPKVEAEGEKEKNEPKRRKAWLD